MTQSEKSTQSSYQERVLSVPVSVSVTLAERKLKVGSLLTLVPGAILPLQKHCDEPLGLMAGGHKLGTVEAVKVGQRFGFRIREIHNLKLA